MPTDAQKNLLRQVRAMRGVHEVRLVELDAPVAGDDPAHEVLRRWRLLNERLGFAERPTLGTFVFGTHLHVLRAIDPDQRVYLHVVFDKARMSLGGASAAIAGALTRTTP